MIANIKRKDISSEYISKCKRQKHVVMELASCVQAVVNASTAYQSNPSDINQVQLQRHLDVLISLTTRAASLSFFNTKDLLPTECLSYLVDILDDLQTKAILAQKIMLLLNNFCNTKELRTALHSTFNLTSCLARFLKAQTISAADSNTLLCLKLLHKVTYECKVSFQEAYIEDLVKFLIHQIQSKEDELTLPCLGLMANLCRSNLPVQMIVKNQEKVKSFYQKLASILSHHNNRIVVSSLSALNSLCSNEDIGSKIFNTKNINQIFQLLVNILMNNEGGTTRRCTVDVFLDLLKNPKIQRSLAIYEHLDSCLLQLLTLVRPGEAENIAKLFELLLALCSVHNVRCIICRRVLEKSLNNEAASTPRHGLRGAVSDTFQAVIHWAGQSADSDSEAPILALDFLKEIYEEILDQGLVTTATARTQLVLPLIMSTLEQNNIPDGLNGRKHCLKLTKALKLAIMMASDESLRPLVGAVITTETCMKLIEHQLLNNNIGLKGMRWQASSDPEDWSEDGAGVLLFTLDLMLLLRKHVNNMESQLCTLLQDSRLVMFFSHGITSGIREHVHIVLKVISKGQSLPEFPTAVLGDCIAARILQQQTILKSQDDMNSAPTTVVFDKENRALRTNRNTNNDSTKPDKDLTTSVDSLIEKMQNGLELKDARASEIISVYEHKLKSLQTKEMHLQDLLEAKALAMTQADRLIMQYRSRTARSEAEAQKMRRLLHEWETKSEEYREQLNETMLDRDRLTNNLEQLAQDNARLETISDEFRELTEVHAEQTQKLENTQRALTTLKQEHLSLSEMHEMLRRHNDSLKQQHDQASQQLCQLEEERKSLSRQLKEKEKEAQDTNKILTRTEKELKKTTKERDSLENAIDKMRENLSKTEQAKKDLQNQVSAFELVCKQYEDTLKDKEQTIKELKANVEKHNKIAELIHNITSGKEPIPS